MAVGDTDVSIVENPTAATVKSALDTAITNTSSGARVTVNQLGLDSVLITAIDV